ncbi:MAG: hypothetical protein Q4B88_05745 [Moraxella sp.]|nr:hypothetical protein [Moraxella sp.]
MTPKKFTLTALLCVALSVFSINACSTLKPTGTVMVGMTSGTP